MTTAWAGMDKMKTENYEVIFAIVNAGFAEDVMDVAGLAVPEPEKKK